MADPKDDPEGAERDEAAPAPAKPAVAVALHYRPETEYAPKVVASGKGAVAEQILQIAFAKGIKVREDADLAELLSAVDIDSEIPIEAFAAVAEILAYVYRANGNWPAYLAEMQAAEKTEPPP